MGATGTLTAQATVSTNCTISATSLAFGSYDPIVANKTTALNGTATVTVACVKGSTPTIGLGLGNYALSGTRRMRHATSTGEFLSYEINKPPNVSAGTACTFPGTSPWGNSGVGLFTPAAAPDKNSRSFNVCGTVPAGQNVEVGIYTDVVVASVNF